MWQNKLNNDGNIFLRVISLLAPIITIDKPFLFHIGPLFILLFVIILLFCCSSVIGSLLLLLSTTVTTAAAAAVFNTGVGRWSVGGINVWFFSEEKTGDESIISLLLLTSSFPSSFDDEWPIE